MPADPQPPLPPAVEAMLRDAARQRREEFDAAGPNAATMPGPMRTRLHTELAKQFDAPAAVPSRGLTRWWPAWVGAIGAAAAVALFVVESQQPPRSPVMVSAPAGQAAARREEPAPPAPIAAAPVPPESPRSAVADTPAGRPATSDPLLAKDKAETTEDTFRTAAEPVRTQTFTQVPLPVDGAVSSRSLAARRGPASAPAAAPGAKAKTAAAKPAPAAPATPTPPPLLGNFRFEQRGGNVRVVDADGSVYVGQVEPEAKSVNGGAHQAETARANTQSKGADTTQQTVENFRFRASGDNRTLRKPVVFEGQYSGNAATPADASATTNNNQSAAAAQQALKQAAPQLSPTPEAQIRGRVRVLDNNLEAPRDAEVDARSVETGTPR